MKGLKKGFTLLELIVVIAVIGVLGTFGYSKFTEVMMETKSAQLGQQLKKIEIGLSKYLSDLGTYPLDINWLVAEEMEDKSTAVGYDSLSLKLTDGVEDIDVTEYWSGPYISDMKTDGEAPHQKIKAVFGDKIEVCAKITANGDKSKIDVCDTANVSDPESFINVLIIKGVDPQAIKYLFKAINGRDMTPDEEIEGNAYAVAKGEPISATKTYHRSDKLGVPAREFYEGATPFVIYKFTDDIQN